MNVRLRQLVLSTKLLLSGLLCTTAVQVVEAIPSLQLDAAPSTYNTGDQSIQATANPFQLYALANNDSSFSLSATYYISLAIVNHSGSPMTVGDKTFGSFSISGSGVAGGSKTYSLSDLVFGNPPFEANLNKDAGDLAPHGIFPTYFAEIAFKFDSTKRASAYNSADTPGALPASVNPNGSLFYQDWNIDVSGLNAGYDLHIDLYDTALKQGGDIDVNDFAPFSHDAVSGGNGSVPVTDGSNSLVLLGLGLIGLVALRGGITLLAGDKFPSLDA